MAAGVALRATDAIEENTSLTTIGIETDPVAKHQIKIPAPDHAKMLGCSTENNPGVCSAGIKRLRKIVVALVALSLCLSCVAVFFVTSSESSIAGTATTAPSHEVQKTVAEEIASAHDEDEEEDEEEDNEGDVNLRRPMYQASPYFPTFRTVNPLDRFVHPSNNSTSQFEEYAADTAEVVDMIDLVKDAVTDFQMRAGSTIHHVRVLSMTDSTGDADTFRVNAHTHGNEVIMDILLMCVDQPWGPEMEDCHIVVPLIDNMQQRGSKESVSTSQAVSVPRHLNRSGTAVTLAFAEHTPTARRAQQLCYCGLTDWTGIGCTLLCEVNGESKPRCRRRRLGGGCGTRRRGACSRRRRAGKCNSRRRRRRR